MVVVAVAGGAGPVGKAIVDGLVEHGGHTIYVLSRSVRIPLLLVRDKSPPFCFNTYYRLAIPKTMSRTYKSTTAT